MVLFSVLTISLYVPYINITFLQLLQLNFQISNYINHTLLKY